MSAANLSMLDNATDVSQPVVFYPLYLSVPLVSMTVFGAFGNLMVIIAVIKTPELQNRCNTLIAILAFADLGACIYHSQIKGQTWFNYFWVKQYDCFVRTFYGYLFISWSGWLSLAIGIDRYVAVKWPIA